MPVTLSDFHKPQPVPLIFILLVITGLLALGIWQVQRLQWKEAILDAITEEGRKPAVTQLPEHAEEMRALQYRMAQLDGTFIHDAMQFRIGRRSGFSEGYYTLTPFQLHDGRTLLVNRGFAPGNIATIDETVTRPEEMVTISGMIRLPSPKKYFAPPNQPQDRMWFYEDMSALEHATGTSLEPVLIEAIGEYEQGISPIPSDGTIRLRNDHLGYAITWFSLAIVAAVMFTLYHRKPKESLPKEPL